MSARRWRWATRIVSPSGQTEDRVAVFPVRSELVVVLADGAGGIPGGGRAADLALAWSIRNAEADPIELVVGADREVCADPEAGEATLVVVRIGPVVRGASAGDSEAWLVGGDVLTASQHRKDRLGSGRCVPVGFSCPASGRLLVASDGLFGYAREADVRAAAGQRHLERAASALVDLVRLPSGEFMDDLALALIDLDDADR